jgi:hypothetical protein
MDARPYLYGGIAAGLVAALWSGAATAQPEQAPKADTEPQPAAKPPAPAAPVAPPVEAKPPAEPQPVWRREPGTSPLEGFTLTEPMPITWHGGIEADLGYAKYTHETVTIPGEQFYDARGRFVLGPEVTHRFGSDYFLRAKAQFVAWIRETYQQYQVNVDDAYAQVGEVDKWDVMAGRFMTWRAYRKGLGFDLYTLEDTGAISNGSYEGGAFYVHIYEVDDIFYRGAPGRVALHVYPTSFFGVELAGQYGKDNLSNTIGGRAAAAIDLDYVSVTAAGEYRTARPALEQYAVDASNQKVFCDDCGKNTFYGGGGSAVIKYKFIEVGASGATRKVKSWGIKDGTPDKTSSYKTTSIGGYAELDVGSLVMPKSLILGFGLDRTERLFDVQSFERHVQGAAYVAYPLGFNDAMVKLVLSKSSGHLEQFSGEGAPFTLYDGAMYAGRVRLKFSF